MSVELAHDAFGETGTPILILHGLLGSARNWTGIAKQLADTRRVFALDLRNHARSPWADTMSFEEMAGDVATFIERHDLSPCALIGHSLGGKVAMRLALTRANLVERLVAVDVAPVAYTHTFGPFVEAMQGVDLATVRQRPDAERQLERTIPNAAIRNFLLQNLVKTEGGYAWRVNLEALAANMPELLGFPAPPADAVYRGGRGHRRRRPLGACRAAGGVPRPGARVLELRPGGLTQEAPSAWIELDTTPHHMAQRGRCSGRAAQ
jgi:esterase